VKVKLRKGFVELSPENLDDLWLLSELILPGDLVKMHSSRKLKLLVGDRVEAERKAMTLKLRVKGMKFHEYSSSLRISGDIVEGPEDVRGSHTFTVDPGSRLELFKDLGAFERDMLKKSQSPQPDVAFVIVDREEAMIAHGSSRTWVRGAVASKHSGDSEDYKQFFGQIKARLAEINPNYVVIAGPGFTKDKLAKQIDFKVIVEGASSVGESGLREVLSRGALDKVGVVIREAEEQQAVELVFSSVKSGKAFYGFAEAGALAEKGNIKFFLMSSSMISKSVKDGSYASLRKLMEKVKYGGGKVMLIGRNKDALARLDGLGGVAGLRRWKDVQS
jgi:protein pelota